jgi:two-component system nitrogen regulation sensor histidine kinase NtrY
VKEGLSLEEKRIRRRRKQAFLIIASLAYVTVSTVGGMLFGRMEDFPFSAKLVFFLLLNLNLLALFWLVYFVARNLFRLVMERRRGVIGTKFKAKVVGIFFVLIAIPIILLFVAAMEIGSNYIDRFFTPQFKKPIESSIEVAKALYELERQRVLTVAQMASEGKEVPPGYDVQVLKESPEDASAAVREAFKGMAGVEVMSGEGKDTVRAALPLDENEPSKGIVVVDTILPLSITMDIERISGAYNEYLQLESYNTPLKLNYLLLLSFFTLIIIFSSTWVSIRIATWMTEPVKNLAQATEEVASGNLSVVVRAETRDEIGMLIESFNHMVKEIKEGKESLEHAYSNLNNIIRNIQSGVVSLDTRGRIQLINEAACSMFGQKADEVIGKPYLSVLQDIESEDMKRLIKSIDINAPKRIEREIWLHIGKKMVQLRVSVSVIKGPRGGILGFLVVMDDITDLIKAQRALAWQEVAKRIAHEIKNPLTPIQLNTERMVRKWQKKDKDFEKIFERSSGAIIEEVQALKSLVNEFSKLGKMPEIKRSATDIREIVKSVENLYGSISGLEVRNEFPDIGVPDAYLDGKQIKRVLINLFENAIEAMKKKGTITVSCNADYEANRLSIEVSDTGPGIPDEDKDKVFAPYFSAKRDGSGLGLAIAERIVSEHGGSISVGDNAPHGSVFTITLPITPV